MRADSLGLVPPPWAQHRVSVMPPGPTDPCDSRIIRNTFNVKGTQFRSPERLWLTCGLQWSTAWHPVLWPQT